MIQVALLIALASMALASMPISADAQILRAIKERAKQKVEQRAESTFVEKTSHLVDSTLEKTGRAVDTVVSRGAVAMDTVLNKTERAISDAAAAVGSGGSSAHDLRTALGDGRAVVPLEFEPRSARLATSAEATLANLASAISDLGGAFLLEGHVEASGNSVHDKELSERRVAAVKERLVAAGIATGRLFAVGHGSSRPPESANNPTARIEIARMQ